MATLFQDARYATRALRRQPGFASIVILTLGLGLGANAAVFGVVDALLVRPLAIPEMGRLVQIWQTRPEQYGDRLAVSPANFLDWRRAARSFDYLGALAYADVAINEDEQQPEMAVGCRVSPGFFEALGVPLTGRSFTRDEETPGRDRVAVISYALWQRRWGGHPVLGSKVMLNRRPFVIVGVGPQDFSYPVGTDVWMPLAFDAEAASERTVRSLDVLGRLAPGVERSQAAGEMATIAARLAQAYPESTGGYGINVVPLAQAVVDVGTPTVILLWQVAGILLLIIAGANVANLLLVRGTTRQRELALRLAVGAGRGRIVSQLLVESVLLALGGALLALPIAWGALHLIRVNMPATIVRYIAGWLKMGLDARLLLVTAAAAIVAGAVFGVLPALRASRPDLVDALKEGGRGGTSPRHRTLRFFVVAQIALALTLLVTAGLSVRGAIRLLTQNDGYDPAHVMTFSYVLPDSAYPNEEARRRFHETFIDRARAVNGVERVAYANAAPFTTGGAGRRLEIEGRPVGNASQQPGADYRVVSPEYFATMRATVMRGRGFTADDRLESPRAALVNDLMAQRLWPGVDAIGRRFRPTNAPDASWLTVVGVVNNVKHDWFLGYTPTFYVPLSQTALDYGVLLVRARGDETQLVPAIRQVARSIDSTLPLVNVHSLSEWRRIRTIGMQYVAALMGAFAGIGLFLAAIGIYGVMAFSVAQRTRELGVRFALGATAMQVLGMTLRDALVMAAAGIAIGLLAAYGLAQVMVANLFGVIQLDAITFAMFALVLAIVAILAGGVPARRAMRVDPIAALRAE